MLRPSSSKRHARFKGPQPASVDCPVSSSRDSADTQVPVVFVVVVVSSVYFKPGLRACDRTAYVFPPTSLMFLCWG